MRVAVKPLLLFHVPNFRPTRIFPTFRNSFFYPPINTPFPFQTLAAKTQTKNLARRISMAASSSSSPPPPPPTAVHVRDKIELTDVEKKVFDRLLGTVRSFGLQTQLRVAGGWVRDKLLGKDCYDIDIALDNMMGSEFGDKVVKYLSSINEESQERPHVIPSNPEQSKHLETANMKICGISIDFVNLRSEEYSDDSRIPKTQKFGTAEEDAYRRDLTINSLFYNINTSSVEDFTKRGIEDLKSGRIVTPLPPKATFLDDPLRVLRAIRFGARFEFTLDEELKEAAACDEVKAALAVKISRERIGNEIGLMISGKQPVKAMAYICDLKLFWVVFSLPSKSEPAVLEGCDKLCIGYLDAAWNLIQVIGCSTFGDEQRRLCLYAAMFLPLRKTIYKDNKAKKIPAVNFIFRESLKLKASYAENVINIHIAMEKFLSLIRFLVSKESIPLSEVERGKEFADVTDTAQLRVLTGFLLREIKGFWRVALLLSTLLHNIECAEDLQSKNYRLDERRDTFKAAESAIIKLGLEKVWEVKPLVNGSEIMKVLGLKSGGSIVGKWQQKILAWQLANPSGTSEKCLEWMKEIHSEEIHSKRVKME